MKLQPLHSVNAQVNAQKKAQIDEGVQLAKKIDALRQTLNALEAQHRSFVEGIKRETERETSHLLERVSELRSEVKILEENRIGLLIPLDEAWKTVRDMEEKLKVLLKSAEGDKLESRKLKESYESKSKDAKDSLGRIKIRERELARAYTEAETALADAERCRSETQIALEAAKGDISIRVSSISAQEEAFKNGQAANNLKRKSLDDREASLNDKERLLNDRYAALERTIKRLEK